MLVFNLGVPRSGTVLVHHMIRHVLERHGHTVRSVNGNPQELEAFVTAHGFDHHAILHGHALTPGMRSLLHRSDVGAFFNFRDPRDATVSLMRLNAIGVDEAVRLISAAFGELAAARSHPKMTLVPYEHLVQQPAAFVFQIAQRFNLFIDLRAAADIADATGREAHRGIMEQVEKRQVEVIARRTSGRTVPESRKHLITDLHIQSGAIGRWRDELDESDRRRVNAAFASILDEYSYQR